VDHHHFGCNTKLQKRKKNTDWVMMSVGGFHRKDPTNPALLPKEFTHNAEEEEAAEERSPTAHSCAHFFDSNTIPGLHNCGSVLNIFVVLQSKVLVDNL